MTDKQIIIYKKECYNEPCCSLNQVLEQLKAKEQECERLKEGLFQIQNVAISLTKQFDLLSAENEALKNFHINLVGVKECEIRELANIKYENQKLKGALLDVLQVSMEELILGFDFGNSAFNKINKICTEVLTKDDEVNHVQDNL